MAFTNFDEMLLFIKQNKWYVLNKHTLDSEDELIFEAERKGLIYKKGNLYGLDEIGYEIINSGKTYLEFVNEKNKTIDTKVSKITVHNNGSADFNIVSFQKQIGKNNNSKPKITTKVVLECLAWITGIVAGGIAIYEFFIKK